MDILTIQATALRYREQWNIMTTKSGDFAEQGARLIPYIDDPNDIPYGKVATCPQQYRLDLSQRYGHLVKIPKHR